MGGHERRAEFGFNKHSFTMHTGLAGQMTLHTFRLSRVRSMLLSSLGFPAKLALVLKVHCSQPSSPLGRISQAPKRRTFDHAVAPRLGAPIGYSLRIVGKPVDKADQFCNATG
jgi:hypothetical protein